MNGNPLVPLTPEWLSWLATTLKEQTPVGSSPTQAKLVQAKPPRQDAPPRVDQALVEFDELVAADPRAVRMPNADIPPPRSRFVASVASRVAASVAAGRLERQRGNRSTEQTASTTRSLNQ